MTRLASQTHLITSTTIRCSFIWTSIIHKVRALPVRNGLITNDALDLAISHDLSDQDLNLVQLFQRCGVWPADGAPALYAETNDGLPVDEDGRNEDEDPRQPSNEDGGDGDYDGDDGGDGGDGDGDSDDGDDGDDLETLDEESGLQGMSAIDEFVLDFEGEIAKSGMILSLAGKHHRNTHSHRD